ncbi:MAG: hypothetical protein LBH48_03895 [Bifidobacteriaceae bacterium]|jgi:hypothetical protein|nr:hypothetical protein [Bifidobacteriaceae bacterium]
MIAGIIPDTNLAIPPAVRATLDQYNHAIETRARRLADQAITRHEPWLVELGPRPADPGAATSWNRAATALATYRELHEANGPHPTQGVPTPDQARDLTRARTPINQATKPEAKRSPDPLRQPVWGL